MTSSEVLVGLLKAEHAAVWAYGLLGARLSDKALDRARVAHDAHRRSRDALVQVVTASGGVVPVPAPGYDVRAATAAAALALAVRVEDDLAARWRDLVATSTEPGLRRLGVRGLQDSAVRAARWRATAKVSPATQAFPGEGLPDQQ